MKDVSIQVVLNTERDVSTLLAMADRKAKSDEAFVRSVFVTLFHMLRVNFSYTQSEITKILETEGARAREIESSPTPSKTFL